MPKPVLATTPKANSSAFPVATSTSRQKHSIRIRTQIPVFVGAQYMYDRAKSRDVWFDPLACSIVESAASSDLGTCVAIKPKTALPRNERRGTSGSLRVDEKDVSTGVSRNFFSIPLLA